MTFTISSITLTGFGTDQPAVGGSPAITNYDGSTLYCHITPNDTSTVDIVFNQTAPNEYIGEGQINSVTLNYQDGDSLQSMMWTSPLPTGSYLGGTLKPYLVFSADLQSASIVLTNAPPSTANDASQPQLTLVMLGAELTLAAPRGYFVNVPIDSASDYQSFTTARISWPKADSMVGPIGSLNVP